MENDNLAQQILRELVIQAPVLFVGSVGLLISLRYWRRAPGASRWCAIASLLALASSALTIQGSLSGNFFVNSVVALYVRGAAYAFFLIGVYAGRPNPASNPADEPQTLWQPVADFLRARPWLKSLFRTAFISTFLLVFVWGVLVTFIVPESYVGSARIRLRISDTNTAAANSITNPAGILGSRQIQTECEVIQSRVILAKVLEHSKLNLMEKWSAKFNGGEPITTPKGILLLQHMMDVRSVPGADLIEVRCYSDRPEEAAELANAVAESYSSYCSSLAKGSRSAMDGQPQNYFAEIVDWAELNPAPVRPNKSGDIFLAFWGALWIGVLVGMLVVWLSLKYDKNRRPLPGSAPGGGPSQEWVTAQNTLGAALRDQARSSDGLEALRLLDEAASAYRAVLAAGIRDLHPKGWAMAQNNLGVLLRDRAEWSPQDLALSLLREAVVAHRSALEFYTRKEHPHYWATTQNNLGIALRDQAKRSQGTEAAQLLNESVAACRAALEN